MTFGMVFFLVLMTLKLTDFIDWTWWLVTAPIWVEFLFYGLLIFVYAASHLLGNTRKP